MKGKRVYPDRKGRLKLQPGDYGRDKDGQWWVRPPQGGAGTLDDHTVFENPDETISVSPSIEGPEYHGHLLSGEWTDA